MWGAENMTPAQRSGWRLFCFGVSWVGPIFFFAFFFNACLLYMLKPKMGVVESVNVTSDISLHTGADF